MARRLGGELPWLREESMGDISLVYDIVLERTGRREDWTSVQELALVADLVAEGIPPDRVADVVVARRAQGRGR